MPNQIDIVVVGSANAALCAAIAAQEKGAKVLINENTGEDLAGGNRRGRRAGLGRTGRLFEIWRRNPLSVRSQELM